MPKPLDPETPSSEHDPLHDVLLGLSSCHKHRRWYASLARPYLGSHPIEIGSGLGDYALEWLPHVEQLTLTDANPRWVQRLANRFSENATITVRQLILPTSETGTHTSVIAYNVLEHISDHAQALHSMIKLARVGSHIILICPAFPFAMNRLDIDTGHFRRYTKNSISNLLASANLRIVSVRYVNSIGLIAYYLSTKVLNRKITHGPLLIAYDYVLVPISRSLERIFGTPPFGQSVLAIAQVIAPPSEYHT